MTSTYSSGASTQYLGNPKRSSNHSATQNRPKQDKMEEEGEDYLMDKFPLLSYFVRAEFVG